MPIVGLTDESGRYRIGSLGAGPVLVSVFSAARSIVMLPGGGVMSGGGDVGQRIYYPGGVKAERGEPVSLQVGHEELGVDFVTPASVPVGPRVAPAPRDATVVSGRIMSKVAKAEGVAVNQLINVAVAEKVSVLRTEEYFAERAAKG